MEAFENTNLSKVMLHVVYIETPDREENLIIWWRYRKIQEKINQE